MFELPQSLRNRFHLYLNVLPIVDTITFYGLFICGIGLLLFAISKVSFNISSSLSSPHHISKKPKYGNQYRTNVYMPCEEKLIPAGLVKCPAGYLAEKNATEMHDIDLKAMSYELENELPLIEDDESSEMTSEGVSSEETTETQTQGDNNKVRRDLISGQLAAVIEKVPFLLLSTRSQRTCASRPNTCRLHRGRRERSERFHGPSNRRCIPTYWRFSARIDDNRYWTMTTTMTRS